MPHCPFSSKANSACPNHCKGPRVGGFLSLGPEAVLGCLVLGKLVSLQWIGLGVLLLLVGLVLSITADVSQECVVGGRSEESDRVELARSPEEKREREVDENISKVAEINRLVGVRPKSLAGYTYLGWRTMLQTPSRFKVVLPVFFLCLLSW
jgi:hypothetical protein